MADHLRKGRHRSVNGSGHSLCRLDEIPDGGSTGVVAETPQGRLGLMLIRRGETVHAYVNSCPHIGSPLDFQPGQFLNVERTLILCSTHGALFRIEDGYCVSGPCAGDSLTPVAVEVQGGDVRLASAPRGTDVDST